MSMMSLDDIVETIRVTKDEDWFVDRFEITIEDMVDRFRDLIVENQEELPYDLGMEVYTSDEEWEDR